MTQENFTQPEPIIFEDSWIIETPPETPEPTTPIGESPFPSWEWTTNNIGIGFWSAPTPQPRVHGKAFLWNEPDLSWYYKDEDTNSWIRYIEES